MVYLLHFDRPYRHVRHYLGAAADLDQVFRITTNPSAESRSPLLHAAYAAGVRFTLVRHWLAPSPGAAVELRRLRRRRKSASLCQLCREARA